MIKIRHDCTIFFEITMILIIIINSIFFWIMIFIANISLYAFMIEKIFFYL